MRPARTVEEGFQIFLEWLSPAEKKLPTLGDEVRASLSQHFRVHAFHPVGSCLNGTDVQGYSIPDYLVSLDYDLEGLQDSRVLPARMADVLKPSFPGASASEKAVTLVTGETGACKLIPARLAGQTDAGHLVYEVPDGSGGWMRVCPQGHLARIEETDRRLEGRCRSLARLVKAWKYLRAVPVSTFYLESRCLLYAAGEKRIVYPLDLQRIFSLFWNDQLADVPAVDSTGGPISAHLARTDRKAVFSGLRTALYYATCAMEQVEQGNLSEAFRYWGRIFGGHFPAYGG